MNTPEAIRDLIPYAYSWSRPRFAFIENGLVFYQTGALSDAGGCSHTISFPVSIAGRTLSAKERWETVADDAIQAIKSEAVRRKELRYY